MAKNNDTQFKIMRHNSKQLTDEQWQELTDLRQAPQGGNINKSLIVPIKGNTYYRHLARQNNIRSGHYEAWEIAKEIDDRLQLLHEQNNAERETTVKIVESIYMGIFNFTVALADIAGYVRRLAPHEKLIRIDKDDRRTPISKEDAKKISKSFTDYTFEMDKMKKTLTETVALHAVPSQEMLSQLEDIHNEMDSAKNAASSVNEGIKNLVNGHDEGESLRKAIPLAVDFAALNDVSAWIEAANKIGRKDGSDDFTEVLGKMTHDYIKIHGMRGTWGDRSEEIMRKLSVLPKKTDAENTALAKLEKSRGGYNDYQIGQKRGVYLSNLYNDWLKRRNNE